MSASCGFLVAAGAAVAIVWTTGFDLVCKAQVFCSVSEGRGWANQIHLSWDRDPATSLTVTWQTPSTDNPDIVEYRKVGDVEWRSNRGTSARMPSNGLIGHRGTVHRVSLTGLLPATAYEYRVSNDRTAPNPMRGLFVARTAPEGPEAEFSFVYFADTGVMGRPDGLTAGTKRILDHLQDLDISFLLGGGDYAYGNADGRFVFPMDAADEWFRQWQPLLSRVPMMAQYGNHESFLRENLSQWLPRFTHPEGFADGRAYSFDIGCAHFTAMYSPGDGFLPPDDLLKWLDDDLRNARDAGRCWVMVFQHDALFAEGASHPSDPRLRQKLMPIFERHNVDLVLTSQDQNYHRTFPLRSLPGGGFAATSTANVFPPGDGVVYASTSPAGKKSERTFDFSRFSGPQPPFIAVRSDDGYHFLRVFVDGSRELAVEAYELSENGRIPTVLDRFAIRKKTPHEGW